MPTLRQVAENMAISKHAKFLRINQYDAKTALRMGDYIDVFKRLNNFYPIKLTCE